MKLNGDEAISGDYWIADQSILLNATAAEIWPWLVQMGNGRAGWYSYDLLDNLGHKSYAHIDASLQNIQQDQKISIFTVTDFKEPEYLTLTYSKNCNMTWHLKQSGQQTTLTTRLRVKGPKLFLNLTLGPGHYLMQRKQFLEIKKRVEN